VTVGRLAKLVRGGLVGSIPAIAPSLLLLAVFLPVMAGASAATQSTALGILVSVIVVVGYYAFVGNSGIVSFGHIGFMAIGAYTAGLLTMEPAQKRIFYPNFPSWLDVVRDAHMDPVMAAVVAGLVAMVFALIVGVPLLRLTGLPAAFATLCLLIIVNVVLANWNSVTRGTSTTLGVPAWATVGKLLVVAIIAVWIAFLFQRSKIGFRLKASREDEHAAAALGINVLRERWVAFGLSAFVVGVGGAMYAYYLPFAAQDFYLDRTTLVVAMLIIGGMLSLWGAVIGALLVGLLSELLRRAEDGTSLAGFEITAPAGTTAVALGLILLVILIVRANGITGGAEVTLAGLQRTWRRVRALVRPRTERKRERAT